MRTVMFKAPLRWLFLDGCHKGFKIPFATWAVIALSLPTAALIRHHARLALFVLTLYAAVAIVVGACVGLTLWVANVRDKKYAALVAQMTDEEEWLFKVHGTVPERLRPKRKEAKPGTIKRKMRDFDVALNEFLGLIGNFLRASHDRVCPELEVVDEPIERR